MAFHGLLTQHQTFGDCGVGQAIRDQPQDLQFALAQFSMALRLEISQNSPIQAAARRVGKTRATWTLSMKNRKVKLSNVPERRASRATIRLVWSAK